MNSASSARRVLLAWELGEGLGHAARLLLLAQRLREQGWAPVVAAREPAALAERYAAAGIPVVAAPAFSGLRPDDKPFRAASFADLMGAFGYASAAHLAQIVAAWDRVLARHAPDLVIADYSPVLSLAVHGRVPLIAVGDGFVTPPATPDGRFPALGREMEAMWNPGFLLDNACKVQAARGLARPDSLPQIVGGNGQVVAVPPELDIYWASRQFPADGPWSRPAAPLPPPASPHPYVFCYLRMRHPLAGAALRALLEARVPGECYLQEASAEQAARLRQAGIRVHDQAPPMREVLARATMLIHHGGIGMLEEAASAGRPQLLLPRHLEQKLNARRAADTLPGVFALRQNAPVDGLGARLAAHVRDQRLMPAAQATARCLSRRGGTAWQSLQAMLARIA